MGLRSYVAVSMQVWGEKWFLPCLQSHTCEPVEVVVQLEVWRMLVEERNVWNNNLRVLSPIILVGTRLWELRQRLHPRLELGVLRLHGIKCVLIPNVSLLVLSKIWLYMDS